MRNWRIWLLVVVLNFGTSVSVSNVHAYGQTVQIGWLSQVVKRTLPRSYLDQNLSVFWAIELNGLDRERLSGLVSDSCAGLHDCLLPLG